MSETVDLVVVGDRRAAVDAAVDALQHGRRVLLVLRSDQTRSAQRLRRRLRRTAKACGGHVSMMTNAEVVCVDGVDGVEAVVIRERRTGRVCGVNASAVVSCDGWSRSLGAPRQT